jgi:hypothetical protein
MSVIHIQQLLSIFIPIYPELSLAQEQLNENISHLKAIAEELTELTKIILLEQISTKLILRNCQTAIP